MRGEQAIFNLEIKKKSGLSINPDIHHSKVFSSDNIKIFYHCKTWRYKSFKQKNWIFFSTLSAYFYAKAFF